MDNNYKDKHYAFFSNQRCEYFPCHQTSDLENFNCLFCYCPLYALGDQCGGNFHYTNSGLKDCTACVFPHIRLNYSKVNERFADVCKLAEKRAVPPEEGVKD